MLLSATALRGPSRLSAPGVLLARADFAFLALASGSETGWDSTHPEVTRRVLEAVEARYGDGVEAAFGAAREVVSAFPEDDLGAASTTLLAAWCWEHEAVIAWLGNYDGWHRTRTGWSRVTVAHTLKNKALSAGLDPSALPEVITQVVRKDFATPHVVKLRPARGDRLVFHTTGIDAMPPDGTADEVADALDDSKSLVAVLDY